MAAILDNLHSKFIMIDIQLPPPNPHHHRSWMRVHRILGLEFEVGLLKLKLITPHQGRDYNKKLQIRNVATNCRNISSVEVVKNGKLNKSTR